VTTGYASAAAFGPPRPLLAWLVVLVALHSIGVGIAMVAATSWSVALGGWGTATPQFFPRQFGVFHFAVAAAYLIEYFRYRGVAILLTAKTIAVVSLVAATLHDQGPWALPAAAAGDAAMGLAVFLAARRAAPAAPQATTPMA
jgi:hypothetical protein